MVKDVAKEEICPQEIYMRLFTLKKLCLMTVVLPLSALVICFVTANIFQRDDIHETHCRVYNIIPSISAITGISPQRYLWRICIALHIGPRLLVAVVYREYHRGLLERRGWKRGQWLAGVCFWLSIAEMATLCGVTYVSNRENYPLHEKIFIIFIVSSLCYMLATLRIHNLLHPLDTQQQRHSYRLKKLFFVTSLLATLGLFVFFVKHRFLCHDMAFSWFSTCEYLIAVFNMSFHMTVVLDFPLEEEEDTDWARRKLLRFALFALLKWWIQRAVNRHISQIAAACFLWALALEEFTDRPRNRGSFGAKVYELLLPPLVTECRNNAATLGRGGGYDSHSNNR